MKLNIKLLDNPLVKHKLCILRDKNTGTKEFRELIDELSQFLCYEAMSDAVLIDKEIETPMGKATGQYLDDSKYAFVPILRAGLGMVGGLLKVFPNAKVGHIGMYRNEETLEPVPYYYKVMEQIHERTVFVLDPMLATGGSADDAINCLKKDGVTKIKMLCIVAAPEGVERINQNHPDVEIVATALDEKLNDIGYIVPGLGDAGDRIFGTK